MAEYYMTYNEISKELDKYIENAEKSVHIKQYKAEVLAAMTGNYIKNDLESVHQLVELWQNQITQPSKLVIGHRYIRVQSMMLHFLAVICTSGLLDAIIESVVTRNITGFNISVGSSVSMVIWELFNSVKKLNNWDFCIYMQAVNHYHKYEAFTKSDVISWLPEADGICNIFHDDKWNCEYLENDNKCKMVSGAYVQDALDSLYSKNLLKKEMNNSIWTYQFLQ